MLSKKKPRIYTRVGDKGETLFPLFKNAWVPKDHIVLEVIGTLDELNSFIGLARSLLPGTENVELRKVKEHLKNIQNTLFRLGSLIVGYGSKARVTDEDVEWLEKAIDEMMDTVTLEGFIIPGGHPSAAALHVARSVCRRLERRLVSLKRLLPGFIDEVALKYVNRLSDYLFVLALYVNSKLGVSEDKVEF